MPELADTLKRVGAAPSGGGDAPPPAPEEPEDGGDACGVCGGLGWTRPDVPVHNELFGQLLPCYCLTAEMEQDRSRRMHAYSNLGHLARLTFDTINPQGRSESEDARKQFNRAYHVALEYASDPFAKSPQGWLTFQGGHGSGKTHLAAAIANQRIESNKIAFFYHVPELLDRLRAAYDPQSEITYSDLLEHVREAEFLILDELGARNDSPWAQEKLRQVFNHRHNAMYPTLVTTVERHEDIDPYIWTRLAGSVMDIGDQRSTGLGGLGTLPPPLSHRMTFGAFDANAHNALTSPQRESLLFALDSAREYSERPRGERVFFTLSGNTGTGKTHLAVAIANVQLEKGNPVFFAFVPELLDHLRATFSPDSMVRYDRRFDDVKQTPLLILDGWGEEQSTPWAMDKLNQIFVHRHQYGLPTVITTRRDKLNTRDPNVALSPEESRAQDPTVAVVVRIDARDYRRRYSEPRITTRGRSSRV